MFIDNVRIEDRLCDVNCLGCSYLASNINIEIGNMFSYLVDPPPIFTSVVIYDSVPNTESLPEFSTVAENIFYHVVSALNSYGTGYAAAIYGTSWPWSPATNWVKYTTIIRVTCPQCGYTQDYIVDNLEDPTSVALGQALIN